MLHMVDDLQARKPFSQKLTTLLAGLCELTHAGSAIAYEVRQSRAPRLSALPLLEVARSGPASLPRRTRLAGAASISHFEVCPLKRPALATVALGVPAWAVEGRRTDNALCVLYALQFADDTSVGFGVVLRTAAWRETFDDRDRVLLDVTWRSHRFVYRASANHRDIA
jgi:hypothetical protein